MNDLTIRNEFYKQYESAYRAAEKTILAKFTETDLNVAVKCCLRHYDCDNCPLADMSFCRSVAFKYFNSPVEKEKYSE